MFEALNRWLVQQIPPVVLLLVALLGWGGFLLITPHKLTELEAQQRHNATADSVRDRRLDRVERVSLNLIRRACWESDEERRLWLECDQVLGNNLPGRRP